MDNYALFKDTDGDNFVSINSRSGNDYNNLEPSHDNPIQDKLKYWWIKWVVVAVIVVAVCSLVAIICSVYMVHVHSKPQTNDSSPVSGMCHSAPCQNDGTCSDKNGQINCRCKTGYTGTICETDIRVDKCASSPCLNNGTCLHLINNFACHCQLGYSGAICEKAAQVNECDSSPCQNGATCLDHVNNVTCQCHSGYTGALCEIDIDECRSIDGLDDFDCPCPPGHTGKLCENVNLLTLSGVSCTESSVNKQHSCIYAYDGGYVPTTGQKGGWYAKARLSSWIQIQLPQTATVQQIVIWFSCFQSYQTPKFNITLSDGIARQVMRTCNGVFVHSVCDGQSGEVFDLQNSTTTSIKITLIGDACDGTTWAYYGIREMELWGHYEQDHGPSTLGTL